jgi:hypothetical protein
MRLKADLLLFMVAIIWGTAFVAQGIAGQYGIAYLYNRVSFMLRVDLDSVYSKYKNF